MFNHKFNSTGRQTKVSIWAVLLLVYMAPLAMAGPGPTIESGNVATATGDQSNGIATGVDFTSPPITILNVEEIIGNISPTSGLNGILFYNGSGASVTINSGRENNRFVITTQGDNASGIVAISEGAPAGNTWLSGVGVLAPSGPAGSGGPVQVTSYSDITTNGDNSYGIFAHNKIGVYNPLSVLSLSGFSVDEVDISLTAVAGSGSNIGQEVAGDNGGFFTLNSGGTWDFNSVGMADVLQPGESIVTKINYQVQVSHTPGWFFPPFYEYGSQFSNGSIAVRVTENDDGSLDVVPEIFFEQFDSFGYMTDGQPPALWPNLQDYVDRLLADMGVAGAGDSVIVTNNDNITTNGTSSHGILAQTAGGQGYHGRNGSFWDAGRIPTQGGPGSNGGAVAVINNGKITTYGNSSAGILTVSVGGTGGHGGDGSDWRYGRPGGTGGTGGEITVTGNGKIHTTGDYSSGILALSQGGIGGVGGSGSGTTGGGGGGFGGKGGEVDIAGSWSISTEGDKAHAVWAKSVGGSAGPGGSGGWFFGSPGSGGEASDGGMVEVVSDGFLTTKGNDSYGIYAQSVGGFGGSGGTSSGFFWSFGGDGGSAGSGGEVDVTNLENGAIETEGQRAHALFAQSIGGGGGSGGGEFGLFSSLGGEGGSGGNGGLVQVTNAGKIQTNGAYARGIYAQSIGGGGGDGGDSAGLVAIGGSGSLASDGGYVRVDNFGSIRTTGGYADAIFAQSIGGGGGSGGASGGLVSIGGSGSGGGNAGNIEIQNSGDINTTGINSRAIVAQSIGGGGGDGAGSGGLVSIGGSGGTSGTAGTVDIINNGWIHTSLGDSSAIFAQSIGGGGGSGAGSGGWFASIGGDGGSAGDGNAVTIINSGVIITDANWSHSILAQSIGGGGGNGGGSGAMFAAIGGDGGSSGSGGAINITNDAQLVTTGDFSFGILAQSIGGGGGNGGGTGAWFASIGGDGGAAGSGGVVTVENKETIMTIGKWSHSIFAQSIGGGGGNGGGSGAIWVALGGDGGAAGNGGDVNVFNKGQLLTVGNSSSGIFAQSIGGGGGTGAGAGALNIALGGDGGAAGNGGRVNVDNKGAILTVGDGSHSIFAQSIGGGGGSADTSGAAIFSLGGEGGSGGNAGAVEVKTSEQLETFGINSSGIFAQSVGGGGGNGGNVMNFSAGLNISFSIGIGGDGAEGGNGNLVAVNSDSNIITHGQSSNGILAQSVGGGGGNGGSSFVLSAAANVIEEIPIAINAAVSIGGDGGVGGNGAAVNIESFGDIFTSDFLSSGILAQSIGGGGGNGGNATSISLTYNCDATGNVAVGGDGGAGGDGGVVDVDNAGFISTKGNFSYGILAQSVGGGGGTGGDSTTISGDLSIMTSPEDAFSPSMSFEMSLGGDGGAGGIGGDVNVSSENTIMTKGAFSSGILAQSIGGGGGAGGNASSYQFELSNTSGPLSDLLDVLSFDSTMILGGDGGAGGSAGNVIVTGDSDIFTKGAFAVGILAQSVGGGGGAGGNILTFEFSLDDILQPPMPYLEEIGDLTSFSMTLEGTGGAGGNGGNVKVTNNSNILTEGDFAHGIFAQSVGGGGGFAGISEELDISTLIFGDDTQGTTSDIAGSGVSFAGSLGGNGSGGNVTVMQNGDIVTIGNGAHGIFAQSAGGQLSGGTVNVTVIGNIIAQGVDSDGILAQSSGGTGGSDITVNILNGTGTVQGGSGTGAGVSLLDGANNKLINYSTITTLNGIMGSAVVATGGNETVRNGGIITGSIDLGTGSNTFNNLTSGLVNAGQIVNLGYGNLLTNDGTLSPGGSGNVFATALTGNLIQTSSGTLSVDLDLADYESDLLDVSGTTNIGGQAGINLLNTGWAKPGTKQTTILSSAGGVTDTGLGLDTRPSAVIAYKLLWPNETDVDLQTSIDFSPKGKGLSHNQRVIGQAVNKIQLEGGSESFAPFAAELLNLPDARTLGDAYDQLSPESFDAFTTTAFDVTQVYTQTLVKRIHSIRSYLDATGKAPGARQTLPHGAWIDGFGKWADQDADGGFTGFSSNVSGVGAGLDNLIEDGFLAGVSFGQAHTTIDLDDDRGHGDVKSYFGSLYGSLFSERSYLDMALSYGRQSFDNARLVEVGELTEVATSSHNGDVFSAYAEAGYNIEMKDLLLQPFAALQYIYLDEESYDESGAEGVNLLVDDRKTESLVSDLGLRLTRPFEGKSWHCIPDVTVAWRHDFDIDDRAITAAFDGSPGVAFTTQSRDIDKDGVIIGGGMMFLNKAGVSLHARFDSELRGDYTSQRLSGGLRFEF